MNTTDEQFSLTSLFIILCTLTHVPAFVIANLISSLTDWRPGYGLYISSYIIASTGMSVLYLLWTAWLERTSQNHARKL